MNEKVKGRRKKEGIREVKKEGKKRKNVGKK